MILKRLAAVVVALLILGAIVIAVTYAVPVIRTFASNASAARHVPLFAIGLWAPIAYFFHRLSEWLSGFFGVGEQDNAIRAKNLAAEDGLARLRAELQANEGSRRRAADEERRQIAELGERMTQLKAQVAELERRAEMNGSLLK